MLKQLSLQGRKADVIELGAALRPIATNAGRLVKSFHMLQLVGRDGVLRMLTKESATRIRGGKKNKSRHRRKGREVEDAAKKELEGDKAEKSIKDHENRVLRLMERALIDPRKRRKDLNGNSDSEIINRYLRELSYPKDRLILDLTDAGIELEAARLIADVAEGKKIQEEADRNTKALNKRLDQEEQRIGRDYVNELRNILPSESNQSGPQSPFKRLADPKQANEVTEKELNEHAERQGYTEEMAAQLTERANEVRRLKERLATDKASKAQLKKQIQERLKRQGLSDREVKFYNQIIRDMIDGVSLEKSLEVFQDEVVLDPLLEEGIRNILPLIEEARGSYRSELEDKLSNVIEFHTGDKFRSGLGDIFQASILSVNSALVAIDSIGAAGILRLVATPIEEAFTSIAKGRLDFFETRLTFRGLFNKKSVSAVITNFNAIWRNLPQDIDDEFFGANDVLRKDFERALRIIRNPSSSTLERNKARAVTLYTISHLNFKVLSTIDLPVRQSVFDSEALTSQFRVREQELISEGLTAKDARAKAKRETLGAQEKLGREAFEQYKNRAREEFVSINGRDAKNKKEETSVAIRALELQREDNLSPDALIDASGAVSELAFIGEPVGAYKPIRDGMLAIANIVPNALEQATGRNMDSLRKFIVPFSNIGANSIRMSVDGVFGLVSAPLSQKLREARDAPVKLSDAQVRNAQRRAIANYAAGLTILAAKELFDDEEGDLFVDIHGFGPPTTSPRRKDLIARGWKPFSVEIKVNGGKSRHIKYGVTPLAFSYGLIGSHEDMQKYGTEGERTPVEKLGAMGYHASTLITDMGGFRNLKAFTGGSDFQSEDNFGGAVQSALVRPFLATAVPMSGNLGYLTQVLDPAVYDNRDPAALLERIPVLKATVDARKAVDANGEPIRRPLGTRVLGALFTQEIEVSELDKHLRDNEIFRTGWIRPASTRFSKSPIENNLTEEERENFLDKEGKPRKMTDKEQEVFHQGWRQKATKALQEREGELLQLSGDQLRKTVSRIERDARAAQQVEQVTGK